MPTTPERLIEIATRHISHNERLKSHNVKEYAQFFEGMKNSVTNQLANKDLTKFSRDRLLALEKNIASDLKEINSEAYKTLKSQARDLAKYESGFEAKALSDVVDHSFNLPSTSQLNSAVFKTPLAGIEGPMKGKLLDGIIKDWSDRTVEKVNGAITAGYYQGKTTAAIVKDVIGTGANFTGGTLAQVKRDTEGIVRTSLQHAANQARQETWNQNSDIVKGVRIFATLDAKTSTICRSLDGQVYPLDEGPRPPFHQNCRTTTVAALDSRFSILDEGATRSARDPETGEVYKVDSQRTYYDWLKGQPANVQDSILGPTRGKLLRDGGLTSKRFAELQLSKNFQPMTLAEMKAIEPIAFEKANIDWEKAGTTPKPIDLRYTPKPGPKPTPVSSLETLREEYASKKAEYDTAFKTLEGRTKSWIDKGIIQGTWPSEVQKQRALLSSLFEEEFSDVLNNLKKAKYTLAKVIPEKELNEWKNSLIKDITRFGITAGDKVKTNVFSNIQSGFNYVPYDILDKMVERGFSINVVKKKDLYGSGRAYYNPGTRSIFIHKESNSITVAHECGHAIDGFLQGDGLVGLKWVDGTFAKASIAQELKEFYNNFHIGKTVKYDKGKAWVGNWIHKYEGKIYKGGIGEEWIAMNAQRFHDFKAKNTPEYFNSTILDKQKSIDNINQLIGEWEQKIKEIPSFADDIGSVLQTYKNQREKLKRDINSIKELGQEAIALKDSKWYDVRRKYPTLAEWFESTLGKPISGDY